MIRQTAKGVLGAAFFLTLVAGPVFAVTLDADFKGSILITGPDGNVSMLQQGENSPDTIPAESVVEVFVGEANISSQAGEKAGVSCLGTEANLAGDCKVSLNCGEEAGVLKVVSGTVTLTDDQGKLRTLNAGDEYQIKARQSETAPPTADADQPGLPADGDDFADTPIDPRNIQAAETPDIPDTREEPASQSAL